MLIMLTEITLSACFLCVKVFIWLTVGVLPVVLPTHIQVALYRIPFAVVVVAVSTFVASGGGLSRSRSSRTHRVSLARTAYKSTA